MSIRKLPKKINNRLGLKGNGSSKRISIDTDARYNFSSDEWAFIVTFSIESFTSTANIMQLFKTPATISIEVPSSDSYSIGTVSTEGTTNTVTIDSSNGGYSLGNYTCAIATRVGDEIILYHNGKEVLRNSIPSTDTFDFSNDNITFLSRSEFTDRFADAFVNNAIFLNTGITQENARIITKEGGYLPSSLHSNVLNFWTFNQNSYYSDLDAFLPIYSKSTSEGTGLILGEPETNQYTVNIWIYTGDNFTTSNDTYFSSIFNLNDGGSGSVATIYKLDSSGDIRFRAGTGITNISQSFGNNELHMITYVCNGVNDEVDLYLDGVFIITETAESNVIQDEIGLCMANFPNGSFATNEVFTSDVSIYNGLKSTGEIETLYNNGIWKRANLIDKVDLINYIKLSSSTEMRTGNIEELNGQVINDPYDSRLSGLNQSDLARSPDATIRAWDSVEQYSYSRPILIDSEDNLTTVGSIATWEDPSQDNRFDGTYDSGNEYTVIELISFAGTGSNWIGTYTNILPNGFEDGYKKVSFRYNSNGKSLRLRLGTTPEFVNLPSTTELTYFEYEFIGNNTDDDIQIGFTIDYADDSYVIGDQFFVQDLTLDLAYKPKHAKLINFTDDEVGVNGVSSEIYDTKTKKRINPIGIQYSDSGGNRITGMTTTHGWTSTSNFTWMGQIKLRELSGSLATINTITGFGRNVGGLNLGCSITNNPNQPVRNFFVSTSNGDVAILDFLEGDFEAKDFKIGDFIKYSVTWDSGAPFMRIRIFNDRTKKIFEFTNNTYSTISYSNNNSFFVGGQRSGVGAGQLTNIEVAIYKEEVLTDTQIDDYFNNNEFPITANIFGAWYLSDKNYFNSIKDISGTGLDLGPIINTNNTQKISDFIQRSVFNDLPIIKKGLRFDGIDDYLSVPNFNPTEEKGYSIVVGFKSFDSDLWHPNLVGSSSSAFFAKRGGVNGNWPRHVWYLGDFDSPSEFILANEFESSDGTYNYNQNIAPKNIINTYVANWIPLTSDSHKLEIYINGVLLQSIIVSRGLIGLDQMISDALIGTGIIQNSHMKGELFYYQFNKGIITNKKAVEIHSNSLMTGGKITDLDVQLLLIFDESSLLENGTNVLLKDYSIYNREVRILGHTGATTVEQLENVKLNLVDIDKYVRNDTPNYLTQFGTIESNQVIVGNEPINTII